MGCPLEVSAREALPGWAAGVTKPKGVTVWSASLRMTRNSHAFFPGMYSLHSPSNKKCGVWPGCRDANPLDVMSGFPQMLAS